MKLVIRYLSILTIWLSIANFSHAQTMTITPATTPPFTPTNLLQQVFLGDGVDVVNISYSGDNAAIGFFQNGTSTIGINKGVVMATGFVNNIPTPNNTSSGTTGNTTGGSDADLSAAIGGTTINDAAVYTIDFIPQSDTLQFKYVFASEEYIDYVCSFADAFGFFISGPGISGPYSNMATNIALVPNSTNPVSVGTINNGVAAGSNPPCILTNTGFYVDNPWNSPGGQSPYEIIYDGFTVVLTATAVVTPCQQYRIKLAIGDALDSAFDSAVFLAASSFGTSGLTATTTTPGLDGTISEGCEPVVIDFVLDQAGTSDYPITYSVGGSAIMGVDYDSIPLMDTIPAGQDSARLLIFAIADTIAEGIDTIELYVNITPCTLDTFFIFIRDSDLSTPIVADTMICPGDTITLNALLPDTLAPGMSFEDTNDVAFSDTNPGSSIISVSGTPFFFMQYGVIDSVCVTIEHIWPDDIDLFLVSPDGRFMELSTDNGGSFVGTPPGINYVNTCFSPHATTSIQGQTGPMTGTWLPEGDWNDLNGSPVNGDWELKLIDDAPVPDGLLKEWSIHFAPINRHTYSWAPANGLTCIDCPNPQASPDSTTTYIVSVGDSYGCVEYDTVTVDVLVNLPPVTATCDSVCQDYIRISWNTLPFATGYEVNIDNGGWMTVNPGDTTFELSGLVPNQSVQFEVRGLGGDCPPNGIDTLICTTPSCQVAFSLDSMSNVTCAGANDGMVAVSALSCSPPFSFALNGGVPQNSGIFTGLTAGNYSMIAVDGVGCSDTINFTIIEPLPLADTITHTDVSCFNGDDGTATVIASGGTPPYTYAWSTTPIQDSITAINLAAGTYQVTITDSSGCTLVDAITINEPTELQTVTSTTIVSCTGGNDGTATVVATNGTTPYTYAWSTTPTQILPTASNLSAGTYYVTVTDGNGCTRLDSAIVAEQSPIVLTTSSVPAGCAGASTGTATVHATGGVGGYTYIWNTSPAQTDSTATGVAAGTYSVTVTDANGCQADTTVTVIQSTPINLTMSSTDATCFGNNDGTATVHAMGGVGGFMYVWNTNPVQTDSTATGLGGGTYTVTVTDANGCIAVDSVTVNAPVIVSLTLNYTNITCAGGSNGTANVLAVGGAGGYSYVWNAGLNPDSVVNNLAAGTYVVTVSDVNGCQAIDSVALFNPTPVTTTSSATDASCNGGNDGTATVVASGGNSPYTYDWNTTPVQNTATATNLTAGMYIVTVTDGFGCTALDTAIVNEPSGIILVTDTTSVSCNGGSDGSALVTASGGTPGYTYAWSTTPIQTTPNATGLPAGIYTVTVTDANNCSNTASVQITQPGSPIVASSTTTDVSCNGGNDGTASITVSGGSPPYTYAIQGVPTLPTITNLTAGSYTVVITDSRGCSINEVIVIQEPSAITLIAGHQPTSCNGGNDGTATVAASGGTPNTNNEYTYAWNTTPVQQTATAIGLTGGQIYTVTVTDANGCSNTTNVLISQPDAITLTTSVANISCNGSSDGQATVTAVGGTPGYTYQWDFATGSQDSSTALNLGFGSYTVTVTDVNGCTATTSVSINQPTSLETTISAVNVACRGEATGSAQLQIAGGVPGYTIQWDANANNQTNTLADSLSAGTYYVSVTDGNGCQIVDSITITEPIRELTTTLTPTNVSCFGERDGVIDVSTFGGLGPYEYSLNGINYNQSTRQIGLTAGIYTVYTRDLAGCTITNTVTITEPAQMTVDLGADQTLVYPGQVVITAQVDSGQAPYTYTWTPVDSLLSCDSCQQVTVTDLISQRIYTVVVTDSAGCVATDNVIIYVDKPRVVYVATGFSPNGDGVNDFLFVQGDPTVVGVRNFRVYDRWGELVFENSDFEVNNPTTGWDGVFKGQQMNSSVFSWMAEVEFLDGEVIIYKGNTTLVR